MNQEGGESEPAAASSPSAGAADGNSAASAFLNGYKYPRRNPWGERKLPYQEQQFVDAFGYLLRGELPSSRLDAFLVGFHGILNGEATAALGSRLGQAAFAASEHMKISGAELQKFSALCNDAAAASAAVKAEEDAVYDMGTDDEANIDNDKRSNKRRKTTGDDDLTPGQLMERLLQCGAGAMEAGLKDINVEKVVADAEENGDDTALGRLLETSHKLKNFSETLNSKALEAMNRRIMRRWKAAKKKEEEETQRKADERERQMEGKKCVECQEVVGAGYKTCAGKNVYRGQQLRTCWGNAMCGKCHEEKKQSGDMKICSYCDNFICEEGCRATQQCGYEEGDKIDAGGCGNYVCMGCANGNLLYHAVLCLQCEMFACHMCAETLIPYVPVCEDCGIGGDRLCNRAECIQDSIDLEYRCTCPKQKDDSSFEER